MCIRRGRRSGARWAGVFGQQRSPRGDLASQATSRRIPEATHRERVHRNWQTIATAEAAVGINDLTRETGHAPTHPARQGPEPPPGLPSTARAERSASIPTYCREPAWRVPAAGAWPPPAPPCPRRIRRHGKDLHAGRQGSDGDRIEPFDGPFRDSAVIRIRRPWTEPARIRAARHIPGLGMPGQGRIGIGFSIVQIPLPTCPPARGAAVTRFRRAGGEDGVGYFSNKEACRATRAARPFFRLAPAAGRAGAGGRA